MGGLTTMPTTLIQDTVEIWRAPIATDEYNSQYRDWDNATRVATGRASVQPSFGQELTVDRQTVIDTYRLYTDDPVLMATGVILATDRVVYQGLTLEVDNAPHLWRHRGADHHLEVALRKVDG